MTDIDKERAAFEAWALTCDGNCNDRNLSKFEADSPFRGEATYANKHVERDWIVWQAARASTPAPAADLADPRAVAWRHHLPEGGRFGGDGPTFQTLNTLAEADEELGVFGGRIEPLFAFPVNDGDSAPVPQNADQAQLMANLGFGWLKEHAPERLTEAGRAAPAVQAAGDAYARGLLDELSRRGASEAGFRLAVQLFDVAPCPGCDFRKMFCQCATPAIQPPPSAEPAPEVPPKITLRYERAGNCMWHVGCATSHHARPCKVIGHHETGSLIECAACGKRGNYPNGGIGDQTVDEVTPIADPRQVVGIVDERYLRPTNGGER